MKKKNISINEERYRIESGLLRICHLAHNSDELMKNLITCFKEMTGCEATGIRLWKGADFPYYTTIGFTEKFIKAENYLCAKDQHGKIILDQSGNPLIECMCGNILCGRFDASKPFFTPHGSFWSSCTTELLASTTEKERQARTRNRCNGEGYESVALLPIRFQDRTFGLVQFNDRRKGMFTLEKIQQWEHLVDYIALAIAKMETQYDLQKSEKTLLEAQHLAHIGSHEYDLSTKQLFWSDEVFRIFGIIKEEFHGLESDFIDRIHPADKSKVIESISNVIKNREIGDFEHRIIRPDGSIRYVRERFETIFDEKNKPIKNIGTIEDITDKIIIEERLKSSAIKWQSTFDSITDIISIISKDHRFIEINKAGIDSLGMKKEDIIGRKCYELIHHLRNPIKGCPCITSLKSKAMETYEIFEDGHYYSVTVWPIFDENSEVISFSHSVKNITRSKLAEEEIRKNETALKHSQSIAHLGHWTWDTRTNQLNWSDEMFKIFGIEKENFSGNLDSVINSSIHPEDREKVINANEDVTENQKPGGMEYRVIWKDGTIRYLWAQPGESIYDENKKIILLFGIVQDITDRKLAENEVLNSKEQLRMLSAHLQEIREEERTRIAREVHDDLGQALSGLKLDIIWLSKKISNPEYQIEKSGEEFSAMLDSIDSIISTVRRISTELRPGVLDFLGLKSSVEWQAREFEKKTKIKCNCNIISENYDISTEKTVSLFRIIQEALTNILRHSQANEARIDIEQDENNIFLKVSDNGIGITDESIKNYKSLGLLGMRERTFLLDGKFDISCRPEGGTLVSISVPKKVRG